MECQVRQIVFNRNSLVFEFGKSKCNQDGTANIDHPWHVYANPLMPEVCPVLALGSYLLVHPNILKGQCKLFEGISQYERFSHLFLSIIKDNEVEFKSIGLCANEFGTHSI